MTKWIYRVAGRYEFLARIVKWFQRNISSRYRRTPAWKQKRVRVPKTQPFLKDWLVVNDLDPTRLSDDVELRYARWIDRTTGQGVASGPAIIVHPRCDAGNQTIAIVGKKPFSGSAIYPLKVWPEGVDRVRQWDANSHSRV